MAHLTHDQLQMLGAATAVNIEAAKRMVEIIDDSMVSGIWGELAHMLNGILNDKDNGLKTMLADWNGFWNE